MAGHAISFTNPSDIPKNIQTSETELKQFIEGRSILYDDKHESHRRQQIGVLGDIGQIIIAFAQNFRDWKQDPANGLYKKVADYLVETLKKEIDDSELQDIISDNLGSQIKQYLIDNLDTTLTVNIDSIIKIVCQQIAKNKATSSDDSVIDLTQMTDAEKRYVKKLITQPEFKSQWKVIYDLLYDAVLNSLKQCSANFDGREELINDITDLITRINEDYEDIIDEIEKKRSTDVDDARKTLDRLRKDLRKEHEKRRDRIYDGVNLKRMSLKKAFIETLRNNAKLGTRNTNIFWMAITAKSKAVVDGLGNKITRFKRIWSTRVMHPIRSLKKWFRWYKLANIAIKGLMLTLKTSIAVLHFGLVVMEKLVIGLVGITTTLFKVAGAIVGGIFSIGRTVISGVVGFIGGTVRTVMNAGKAFYNFLVNNTFIKRFLRFITTDAGAAFLGMMAAFIKVKIINRLFPKVENPDDHEFHMNMVQRIIHKIEEFGNNLKGEIADTVHDDILLQNKLGLGEAMTDMQDFYNGLSSIIGSLRKDTGKALDDFFGTDFISDLVTIYETLVPLVDIGKMVARYRFTAMALRYGKLFKHPLLAFAGLALGLITDTAVNNKMSNATISKDNNVVLEFINGKMSMTRKDRTANNQWNTTAELRRKYNGKGTKIKRGDGEEQDYGDYLSDIYNDFVDSVSAIDEETDSLRPLVYELIKDNDKYTLSTKNLIDLVNDLRQVTLFGRWYDLGNQQIINKIKDYPNALKQYAAQLIIMREELTDDIHNTLKTSNIDEKMVKKILDRSFYDVKKHRSRYDDLIRKNFDVKSHETFWTKDWKPVFTEDNFSENRPEIGLNTDGTIRKDVGYIGVNQDFLSRLRTSGALTVTSTSVLSPDSPNVVLSSHQYQMTDMNYRIGRMRSITSNLIGTYTKGIYNPVEIARRTQLINDAFKKLEQDVNTEGEEGERARILVQKMFTDEKGTPLTEEQILQNLNDYYMEISKDQFSLDKEQKDSYDNLILLSKDKTSRYYAELADDNADILKQLLNIPSLRITVYDPRTKEARQVIDTDETNPSFKLEFADNHGGKFSGNTQAYSAEISYLDVISGKITVHNDYGKNIQLRSQTN